MKINKTWHLANPMPSHPTVEERLNWHIEHAKNCHCRLMPESAMRQIMKSISGNHNGKQL